MKFLIFADKWIIFVDKGRSLRYGDIPCVCGVRESNLQGYMHTYWILIWNCILCCSSSILLRVVISKLSAECGAFKHQFHLQFQRCLIFSFFFHEFLVHSFYMTQLLKINKVEINYKSMNEKLSFSLSLQDEKKVGPALLSLSFGSSLLLLNWAGKAGSPELKAPCKRGRTSSLRTRASQILRYGLSLFTPTRKLSWAPFHIRTSLWKCY